MKDKFKHTVKHETDVTNCELFCFGCPSVVIALLHPLVDYLCHFFSQRSSRACIRFGDEVPVALVDRAIRASNVMEQRDVSRDPGLVVSHLYYETLRALYARVNSGTEMPYS